MAGYLWLRKDRGRNPRWSLADYDINLVVGDCLQIATDANAGPVKVLSGDVQAGTAIYEDESKLFTAEDDEALLALRRTYREQVQEGFDKGQTQSIKRLVKKDNDDPNRVDLSPEDREKIAAYRYECDKYFGEHFNRDFISDREVQRLLLKRLQGREDERITELENLIDVLNAENEKKDSEKESKGED